MLIFCDKISVFLKVVFVSVEFSKIFSISCKN